MTYHVDERDIMFNLLECPGLGDILKLPEFEDFDEDTATMIYEQSRGFCQKVLAPVLAESDRFGCHLKDGEVHLAPSVGEAWEKYKELDLIGMNSDPEYGGAGLPHMFSMPVTEMECGSFVAFSMLPLLTRGSARLVLAFGNDNLKDTYLHKMFSGEWTGTMCLTEPHAGSDVGSGSTKAVPHGDHYKISGTKIFISWGEHQYADNIIHLVLARVPGAPEGTKGLSLFVVPKFRVDADGKILEANDAVCGNVEHKMGIKASPTCVINFGNDDDCIGYLVGEENQGIRYMFQMMNEARIEVGVQGLGIASAAYLTALEYAKERSQGVIRTSEGMRVGKIIEHEDIRRMLLKMRAIVHGGRALLYHLMYHLDMTHHPELGEKSKALVELLTPISKSYCSDQGFKVTELGIQIHGGYGFCQDYLAEQYMRDCKISSIYEGTNGIQALDLVFRKILKNQGAYLKVWLGDVKDMVSQAAGTGIADLADSIDKSALQVAATATQFGKWAMTGKDDLVRFHATEFQDNMGHVMIGYCLLRQAVVAQKALEGEVSAGDKKFYEQKLVTLRYWCEVMLPGAVTWLQTMCRDHEAGLQADFT